MINITPFKTTLLITLALGALACEEEDITTASSPVQAVTLLLEKPDGTVEAELTLISTTDANNHQFVNEAKNTSIRIPVPGGKEVSLESRGNGKYAASSKTNPDLEYIENETYQYKFDLDSDSAGQVTGGNFVAVMDSPYDQVSFNYFELPDFDGDSSRFSWSPVSLRGIYTIRDAADEVVYQNYDFTNSSFSGDKWARLASNGMATLGTDIYQQPGEYSIEFCAVDFTSGYDSNLSAELGVLSGFLIGRCAEVVYFTVED